MWQKVDEIIYLAFTKRELMLGAQASNNLESFRSTREHTS